MKSEKEDDSSVGGGTNLGIQFLITRYLIRVFLQILSIGNFLNHFMDSIFLVTLLVVLILINLKMPCEALLNVALFLKTVISGIAVNITYQIDCLCVLIMCQ